MFLVDIVMKEVLIFKNLISESFPKNHLIVFGANKYDKLSVIFIIVC